MAARTFPNVYLALGDRLVIGEVVADGDALEHRSKKAGTVRMEPVREVSLTELGIHVVFGEGAGRTGRLVARAFGGLRRVRAANEQLASWLEEAFGFAPAAVAKSVEQRRDVKAARREMLPAGRLLLPETARFKVGHFLHAERGRQIEYNKVEVIERYRAFEVELPRPSRGVGRSAVTCPVCSATLKVSVPSGARLRAWEIGLIAALIAAPILAVVVLAASGFMLEGGPFVVLLLAVLSEILFVGLLVRVIDKDGIRVRGAKHKRMD